MNQKRLALISYHSCPIGMAGSKDTGGMNVYVRELAVQLGKRGHHVDVYTRLHGPEEPQIIELGENARLIHVRAGTPQEVTKASLYSYMDEFAANLDDFRRMQGLEYDLIFSHYWLSGWAAGILSRQWQVPYMAMFHTLGVVKNGLKTSENEPQIRLETERKVVIDCNRVIASTEQERSLLVREFGTSHHKISVIPCGVNLNLFRPMPRKDARRTLGIQETDRVILYVGRIEKLKAIDHLVEAMEQLKTIPRISLLIVGGDEHSNEEVERLKEKASVLELDGMVHFLSSVPQETLVSYYSAADVLVLPSYYESFGMVAIESLACGTPVVASQVGDLVNIIRDGETGFVIEGNSPNKLSEKLRIVLTQFNANQSFIRESVIKYGWERIAELVERQCELEITAGRNKVSTCCTK